jgi:hypothetical protein
MKKYILLLPLAVISYGSPAQTIQSLKKDMYGIASDATEGRFTGSPGYFKAAHYVINELKAAGIKPGWTTENGKRTYLQPVPFIWDDYTGSTLTVNGVVYGHSGYTFIVVQPGGDPGAMVQSPLFIGNGREEDYAGVDAAGKWVVLSQADSLSQALLAAHKVAGVILLPDEHQAKDWETTVIRQYRFGYMHYMPDGIPPSGGIPYILVSPELARVLVKGCHLAVKLMRTPERVTAYNVIGVLPGRDPKLKDQTIVVGAHLDHIGKIGNHIYNGANDDASGCVAELGAAKALMGHPCKRTLLFVFYTGEELNLKGSGWFMDHLSMPATNLLVNINLEQVGSKHRSFPGIWAVSTPGFEQAFYQSGKIFPESDLKYTPADSLMDEMSNTDSYSFIRKNVPSILLSSGGFDEHHTVLDKIDLIDFPHLRKATVLLNSLVEELGNRMAPYGR